ncbi:DUF6090 family protein [Robiginitalea sp. IMCC44478]|uniref:DUF6090 family protein n=1 Tax=Robiginitalea sp. IMCC44478 TaxID=3459122 RepID=UPI0040432E26
MFRFFRQLRQKFLAENRFSRYFLYAVGEILLVVIGILIALQVNNWNEGRKDRVLEKEVLFALKQTLENDVTILEDRVNYFNGALESGEIIMEVLESKLPYNDSLGVHFSRAVNGYGGADVISTVGYEALKSSGFSLILNKVLKNDILQLFETTYRILISVDNTFVGFNPYYKEVVGGLFYQNRKYSLKPFDYNSLFESVRLYSVLKDYHFNCDWMKEETVHALSETQRVLQLINEELNQIDQ